MKHLIVDFKYLFFNVVKLRLIERIAYFYALHKMNISYYGRTSTIVPLPLTIFLKMVEDSHKAKARSKKIWRTKKDFLDWSFNKKTTQIRVVLFIKRKKILNINCPLEIFIFPADFRGYIRRFLLIDF